jgi:fluoride exporter
VTGHRPGMDRDDELETAHEPDIAAPKLQDSHAELPNDPDVVTTPSRPLRLQAAASAWVFVGGVVGTWLRYVIENALPQDGAGWPWATFLINLAGAFLLGALLEGLARLGEDVGWRQRARLIAGTGGCGAFTTYSTLALEMSILGKGGHVETAVGYGAASVIGGVLTAWLGIVVAADVHRRRARS